MQPRVIAAIALAFLIPTIGLSQGPIRNWRNRNNQTSRSVTRTYYHAPVVAEPGQVMYCTGPDCQVPKTYWAQPQAQPVAAPAIVVNKAPETIVDRSQPKQMSTALAEELSEAEIESGTKFSRALVKAAIKAQREGQLKRTDVLRLRVAMLSPAFRAQAEELCLVQIAASGEDTPFEYSDDGTIIRTAIDWDGLAAFLEKVVPLILTLLKAFGLG